MRLQEFGGRLQDTFVVPPAAAEILAAVRSEPRRSHESVPKRPMKLV